MKRALSILMLMLPVALMVPEQNMSAQAGGQPVMSAMDGFAQSISGRCVSFDYSYALSAASGGRITGSGHVIFQGDCFRQEGDGLETICDGKTKWTVDRSAKEAVAESVDSSSPDYLSYPTFILRDMDKVFIPDQEDGGKGIKLRPAVPMGKISSALLSFAKGSTYRPESLDLYLDDGSVLKLSVSGYEVSSPVEDNMFSFDAGSLGEGYVITDLR